MAEAADLAFHFSIGIAAFFSPCGFPMLPAYLAYYLPSRDAPRGPAATLRAGLTNGALAATGALLALLAVGALAFWLGAPFKQRVAHVELIGGLLVITMGALMLAGRSPTFKLAASPSRAKSGLAVFAFGALYAGVAAGCVAPLLLFVLGRAALATTFVDGALLVGAYAAGLASLLLVVTVLIAFAQDALVARMRRVLPYVERGSGAVMVVVGVYLVIYWAGVQYGFYVPILPAP